MFKRFLLITILISLFGCSTTAMYVPKLEEEPHGYYEVEIDVNRFRVSYETYKPIETEDAFNYVLRRSAELAKENGFESFKLLSKNEETVTELIEIPEVVGVIAQAGKSSALHNLGWQQRGVIVPAHTKAFTIKKLHAEIEFTSSNSDQNIYLVKALIE